MAKQFRKLPKIRKPSGRINLKTVFKPTFKKVVTSAVILAIALFAGMGYVYFTRVLTDPTRTFNDMLANNLQTNSLTHIITQKAQDKDVEQKYFLQFTPDPVVTSTTTIDQVGLDRQKTSVTTDTIGTKKEDYVQYSNITLPAATAQKQNFNNVINQWAKRTDNPATGETVSFLNEGLFMFFPFGNVSPDNRQILLDTMKQKNAYKITASKKDYQNGRFVMLYHVQVNPKGLVSTLSKYVELTGAGDKSQLNPEDYSESQQVDLDIVVDVLSRHLLSINFSGQGRTETFASYGMHRNIELPKKTISIEELQGRIQPQQ